jgi:hypothetical protein
MREGFPLGVWNLRECLAVLQFNVLTRCFSLRSRRQFLSDLCVKKLLTAEVAEKPPQDRKEDRCRMFR